MIGLTVSVGKEYAVLKDVDLTHKRAVLMRTWEPQITKYLRLIVTGSSPESM
jgi:hypothetical protein